MRILHINCNYLGTALHQTMVEHLSALGVESHVFVPVADESQAVIQPNVNVTVSECFQKWDRAVFDYKQAKIINSAKQLLNAALFDCIHAYTLFTDGNCAMRLSEQYGIPFVVTVRNTDVNAFLKYMVHLRRRGIRIMKQAAVICFLSEAYREQVFKKYVPKQLYEELYAKTVVIPNGIDDFWLEHAAGDGLEAQRAAVSPKALHLIYAGRIDKNKNIPITQQAMKLLAEKGYCSHLTVVGKVQDQKEFQKIIADADTTYIEAMPKEQLIELYRKHDIFVMPSRTETFGLVYAEAMSQGLPVVYSQGQGFDGQFDEGAVGYHAAAQSPQAVAAAIEKIVAEYPQIARRAPECAKKFSWDAIVREYGRIYKMILGGAFNG